MPGPTAWAHTEPEGVFFAESSTKQPRNRLHKHGRNMPLFQTRTFAELGRLFIAWGSGSLQLCSGLSSPDRAHQSCQYQQPPSRAASSLPARMVHSITQPGSWSPALQERDLCWEGSLKQWRGSEHLHQGCLQFSSLPVLLFAAPTYIKIYTHMYSLLSAHLRL